MDAIRYHWACCECLACHVTGSRDFAVDQARAHIRDFDHTIRFDFCPDGRVGDPVTVVGLFGPRDL